MIATLLAALLLVQSAAEQATIESISDQGTFLVRISLVQDQLQNNAIAITFIDAETHKEIQDVVYDFAIYSDAAALVSKTGQTSTVQNVSFGSEGSYRIAISNIEGLGEGATFDVRVTPEFPALAVAAVAFSALAAAWRARLWR